MRSPPLVTCFRDALDLAMEIADEFAFANTALVLDLEGRVLDGVIHDDIGRPIDPLVDWVVGARSLPHRSILLVSIHPVDLELIREEDLAAYRRAARRIGAGGARLADWIETDGDRFRSYAYVVHPSTAWIDDPRPDGPNRSRPP